MTLTIAPVAEADMEPLVPVLRAAYKADRDYLYFLRQYFALQPECALVAKLDGRVVGFGAATIYGPFSYIGLMATDPGVQRQGVAGRVLAELMSLVEASGCPTLLLDASAAGRRLYENSGFIASDSTVVLRRETHGNPEPIPGRRQQPTSHQRTDMPSLAAFDAPLFGADRSRLLAYLDGVIPERFVVSTDADGRVDGYLIAQKQTIGPWVALDRDVAEDLVSRALEVYAFDSGPEIFTSGSNTVALEILAKLGFREQRRLSHMYKGRAIQRARTTAIYGQTSLGLGREVFPNLQGRYLLKQIEPSFPALTFVPVYG
jgi:ribosomal protein S18 acetylase RimI-like enzyme